MAARWARSVARRSSSRNCIGRQDALRECRSSSLRARSAASQITAVRDRARRAGTGAGQRNLRELDRSALPRSSQRRRRTAQPDDALDLCAAAAADGTAVAVATPHINFEYPDLDANAVHSGVQELRAALEQAGIAIELRTGAEVALVRAVELADEELRRLTLGGGPTVLLELPWRATGVGMAAAVARVADRGLRGAARPPRAHAAAARRPRSRPRAGRRRRLVLPQCRLAHRPGRPPDAQRRSAPARRRPDPRDRLRRPRHGRPPPRPVLEPYATPASRPPRSPTSPRKGRGRCWMGSSLSPPPVIGGRGRRRPLWRAR